MHTRILGVLLLALSTAIGCASVDGASSGDAADLLESPQTVRESCKVKLDDYRGTATVSCSERSGDFDGIDGESNYRVHLRGMANRGGAESFQLYVSSRLDGGWQNFRAARDQNEIPLDVSKIDRKKRCESEDDCTYYEHFGVAFTRPYLEARKLRGIALRVRGHSGESTIELPAAYVEGFMMRFDEARGGSPASARAAAKANRRSFCKGKYGRDEEAYAFCEQQARSSYDRLAPVIKRTRNDSFTAEAKALDQCMKRHGSQLGLDWMMVEHCYGRAIGQKPAAASRQ